MPRGDFDRSARKADTRARLLAAAARVYARRGLDGATLDEVAGEAGFTKGAVYGHFGSKENLLMALMEEEIIKQVVEQIELFDRDRDTWERPLAGSERWMRRVDEEPDPFRLFVELWTYAQRDERLRSRVADGLAALRATFARFATAGAIDASIAPSERASEQFASVMLALAIGLPMLRLVDPEVVGDSLLGAVVSVLIGALESSPEARALIEDPEGTLEQRMGARPTAPA